MPKVINIRNIPAYKRAQYRQYRDSRLPSDTMYIGRPSKWGNPFQIGKDSTREEVISKYEAWIKFQFDLMDAAKIELKGKNLACYCSSLPCHGDVLIHIANE